MNEKHDPNNDYQKLFVKAGQFLEHLVDKKIAADKELRISTSRLRAKRFFIVMLLLLAPILVGAGAYFFNIYAEYQDRRDAEVREANLQNWEMFGEISNALSNIREGKDIAQLYCGKDIPLEKKEELKVDKIQRHYQLVSKATPVLPLLSDNFQVLLINFLTWDGMNDYCSPTVPKEEEWEAKQTEIEREMVLNLI